MVAVQANINIQRHSTVLQRASPVLHADISYQLKGRCANILELPHSATAWYQWSPTCEKVPEDMHLLILCFYVFETALGANSKQRIESL